MALIVRRSHPHFAPSVETVRLSFLPPANKQVDALTLEITDRSGALVFKRVWPTGAAITDRTYDWTGEDNQSAPVLHPVSQAPLVRYVTPLGSPYRAEFEATLSGVALQTPPRTINSTSRSAVQPCRRREVRDIVPDDGSAVQSGSIEVQVLYREVRLEPMPWLDAYKAVSQEANGAWPAGGTDDVKKMWMQYKLNELGYWAGPIHDPPNEHDLLRALFRYTQVFPDRGRFPKVYDYQTLAAGAPGTCAWGWKTPWENLYGTLVQLCQGGGPAGGATLLNALQGNEQPRNDVFQRRQPWVDQRAGTNLIVDHDLFYINSENTDPDAHVRYDKEFLNRPCWPLRAKVLLVSRDDRTATAAGVDAPDAVGPVECEWSLFDPPENMRAVPRPVTSDVPAKFKSKTRIYLDQHQRSLAGQYGNETDAQDNCPVDLGGERQGAGDMNRHFGAIGHASTSVARGTRFFAKATDFAAAPGDALGVSAAFFSASYVAGDNYVVQVQLNLDHVAGGALKARHQALRGLANCFQARRCLDVGESDPLIGQTGTATVWRRHHVLREVYWMDTAHLPATDWAPVVRNFAAAHIMLVPPSQPPIHVENLFGGPARGALAQALVDGVLNFRANGLPSTTNKAYIEFNDPNAQLAFHRGGLYPVDLPDFDTVAPPGSGKPAERFTAYASRLVGIRQEWPTYAFLRDFFRAFREQFDALDQGPGLVVLRASLMPHPSAGNLPTAVAAATQREQREFKYGYRALSAGGDYGVVLLDDCAVDKFEETFLVSHEVGHCMFLTHQFQFGGDHDDDQNCIMTYNSLNGGEGIGWASSPAGIPSDFYMRVDLRASTPGIPSVGSVSGEFRSNGPKNYWFEGPVPRCQKALRTFKLSPDRKLATGTTILIELLQEQNKVPPALSVELTHAVTVPIDGGSVKPFENVRVFDPDPSATRPFFCGKCVLKLRGWRVREDANGTSPPPGVPVKNTAIPVNPRMEFVGYKTVDGTYTASVHGTLSHVDLNAEATDPLNPAIKLGPMKFLHKHRFTWESSDGNLASLANVQTRELVRFDHPTQAAPFCDFADPDQFFASLGGNGDSGGGIDEHSVGLPALICASPRSAGSIVAVQWYQYSLDNGATWINIEEGCFLLEKTVYHNGREWILKFKKTNHPTHNPTPFSFEAHYRVGQVPASTPYVIPYHYAGGSIAQPTQSAYGLHYLAGANEAVAMTGSVRDVEESWLLKRGFLAPRPWP